MERISVVKREEAKEFQRREFGEEESPGILWVLPGNPTKFDAVSAFRELGKIQWKQTTNVREGDVVYLYLTNPVQAIRFRCRVKRVNLDRPTIDDRRFDLVGKYDGSFGRYMELECIEEYEGELFSLKNLRAHGFVIPQGASRMPKETREYLRLVNELRHAKEMDPKFHDASYELLREVIRSYERMENLSSIDFRDLNLVYLSTIGTWKHGVKAKKKSIRESHLSDAEKNRLDTLLDRIEERVRRKEYENRNEGADTFGMFGTGFQSFERKTDPISARNFIEMCIDLDKMQEDEKIFKRVAEVLKDGFPGMRSASLSVILHCLKPFVFPIFNNNMGNPNIYAYLGVELVREKEVDTYIKNCRRVKAFRDRNFTVRNYRLFDIAAWELEKDMEKKGLFGEESVDEESLVSEERFYFDRNLILYGPPGTGKTYHTVHYAVAICDERALEETKSMDYEKVKERYDALMEERRIISTTFHQSYGYEEFIEGIRPIVREEGIGYHYQDGIFKAFCRQAEEDERPYVFIIDEINRGNLSKIFGELITLVEDTKRKGMSEELSVVLPYSGERFSVPKNLYLLGTMNTADRSIALMDTALRRRFRFQEMMPDVGVLDGIRVEGLNVGEMLATINRRIEILFDREHMIGHAFFTKLRENPSIELLGAIFQKDVIPLLQEYFYEDYGKIRLVLGDNDKEPEYRFILEERTDWKRLFRGKPDLDFEEECRYRIQEEAFLKIESYQKIGAE